MAFKEACRKANPFLMEPIMKVEVVTPEANMGDVIGDLSSRRAKVNEMGSRGNVRFVRGTVPLSEMFGYSTIVRSISQGRASFNLEPSHYEEVPSNISKTVIEKRTQAAETAK
jgi:elongation factor G